MISTLKNINHGVISAADKDVIQRYDEENIFDGELTQSPAEIEGGDSLHPARLPVHQGRARPRREG